MFGKKFEKELVFCLLTLLLVSMVLLGGACWATVEYTVTEIPGLSTGNGSYPAAINNYGVVTGYSYDASSRVRGFIWQIGSSPTEIGVFCDSSLSDSLSNAFDINDSGIVVGYASTTVVVNGLRLYHAFKLQNGTMTDLTPNDSNERSSAQGINSFGNIVGYRTYSLAYSVPLKWDSGTLSVMGTMTGLYPESINDLNRIVSNRWIYASSQYYTLPTFNGTDSMSPTKINIAGQIVGRLPAYPYNNSHAFMWKPDFQNANNGTLKDLGYLGGGEHVYSDACDINSWGVVVGTSTDDTLAYRAIIWKESTGMVDLNSLIDSNSGWFLRWAKGINDRGQIVCWGTHNGVNTGCLLTPIP